jgi:adenine specific DNA methylase Mod
VVPGVIYPPPKTEQDLDMALKTKTKMKEDILKLFLQNRSNP